MLKQAAEQSAQKFSSRTEPRYTLPPAHPGPSTKSLAKKHETNRDPSSESNDPIELYTDSDAEDQLVPATALNNRASTSKVAALKQKYEPQPPPSLNIADQPPRIDLSQLEVSRRRSGRQAQAEHDKAAEKALAKPPLEKADEV